MTDFNVLKEMLDRAEIVYEIGQENLDETTLDVERGYVGFYTCFLFDKFGKLKDMYAYE